MKDEDLELVISTLEGEEAKKAANDGRRITANLALITLGAIMIISASLYNYSKLKKDSNNENHENQIAIEEEIAPVEEASVEETPEEIANTEEASVEETPEEVVNTEEASVEEKNVESEESVEETQEVVLANNEYSFNKKEVDYSNVDTFFNQIVDYRNKYGQFAESFQTREDVTNTVDFFYKFNDLYNADSTISSQEQFDEIIGDYYSSCAAHGVDANLNILFKKDSLMQKLLQESESLVNNLKNGKGSDYSIANQYYIFLARTLIDGRTSIQENQINAPFIELYRNQADAYANVGNMYAARKNQKNDALNIEDADVYYAHQFDDNVVEINKSYTCPNSVYEFVSKVKNNPRWIVSEEGSVPFETVDYYFDYITKGRTR